MSYKKAKYVEVMICPNCEWHKTDLENGEFPDRYDWIRRTDENGVAYIECYCGCEFIK